MGGSKILIGVCLKENERRVYRDSRKVLSFAVNWSRGIQQYLAGEVGS